MQIIYNTAKPFDQLLKKQRVKKVKPKKTFRTKFLQMLSLPNRHPQKMFQNSKKICFLPKMTK